MDLAKGKEREMRGVVAGFLPPPKTCLPLPSTPDDGENIAFDVDLFAQRGLVAKERLGGVAAQDHDVGPPPGLFRGEKSPFGHVEVVDLRLVFRIALEHRVLDLVAPVFDGKTAQAAGRRTVLQRRIDGDDVRQHPSSPWRRHMSVVFWPASPGWAGRRRWESERPSTRSFPATAAAHRRCLSVH